MNASPQHPMTFDVQGLRAGAIKTLPVAMGVAIYGLVYGMLAGQSGMTPGEVTAMSALVFAGASQFVALDLWIDPLPVGALIVMAFIVNLRHVLMGAAIQPWFSRLSPLQAYGSMYFMVDESWALTIKDFADGHRRGAFMLGSGLVLFATWLSASLGGLLAGSMVPDPTRYGLDFAFTAAFIALLAGLWRGKSDLPIWIAAAVVAIIGSLLLPGKWYILAGGLAGGLTGALRHD
ncbi:AzlC family ABC transporter permease [Desulfovibrio ferrophilus]|uniref:AzlC family protein n=1 Tax=Desulfovibrio ferrophilus TaxID=241368 RepID=A0A2Z6B2N2_9BACT|nr:AzlC family ABC transporter permease [Desulfovibrio ferrophilus]BBD09779.1 AzlC family protein [Desulfovibrio ferrophilus]